MLKAGDVYVIDAPVVNPQAIADIKETVRGSTAVSIRDPEWEGGWEGDGKGGKLTTRLSNWLYKQHNVKIDSFNLSIIGNHARNLIIPGGVRIEVTDNLDWDPGDYGDYESCFFKSKRQSFPVLHHLGARVAKIFVPNRQPGRCLILDSPAGNPLLFNFYGITSKEGKAIFKAAMPGTRVHRVGLTVAGSDSDPIYVNHTMAYEVGGDPDEELIDLNFQDVRHAYHHKTWCEGCYAELANAPGYYSSDARYISYVCQACFAKHENSTRLKWTIANLVPVPLMGEKPVEEPKARKVTYEFTDEARRPLDGIVDLFLAAQPEVCGCGACRTEWEFTAARIVAESNIFLTQERLIELMWEDWAMVDDAVQPQDVSRIEVVNEWNGVRGYQLYPPLIVNSDFSEVTHDTQTVDITYTEPTIQ